MVYLAFPKAEIRDVCYLEKDTLIFPTGNICLAAGSKSVIVDLSFDKGGKSNVSFTYAELQYRRENLSIYNKENPKPYVTFFHFPRIDLHKLKYNGNVKSNCGFGRSITFVTTKNYFDRRGRETIIEED